MSMLSNAFQIAVDVHGEQVDQAGEPYLFHVMRVAMAMDNEIEFTVAILHDAVENTRGRFIDPASYVPTPKIVMLRRIETECGLEVATAVAAITRWDDEEWMPYVKRLAQNTLALRVKRKGDIPDNSNERRLNLLPAETADRLRKKYSEALEYLKGVQSV